MATLDDTTVTPAFSAPSRQGKVWLPNVIYECVPYFYILAGFAAFFTTLYIEDWYWMVPHWVLLTALCLHVGGGILYKRIRYRSAARKNG
ncbi:MAG: hypothetical protein AAAFM81_06245 [Pseudomonadota bacterium]